MEKEIEVMKIFRLPPMGKLVVAVNSQRYENISEVTESNKKRLLLAAIGELIVFAGGYQELVNAGVAPHLKSNPAQQDSDNSPAALLEKQKKFLAKLEAERDAIKATPSPKPSFPILSGVRPVLANEALPESIKNKSLTLVEQIDKILQKHVASDPDLNEQSIHLIQGVKGGLQIQIDDTRYEKPRDIPNKKIQLVIKRALKEWEAL